MVNENQVLRDTINKFRWNLFESGTDDIETSEPIPYTANDEVYTRLTDEAKKQAMANFSDNKTPIVYYPEEKNVKMTGVLPSLKNAKFEFDLQNGDGTTSGIKLWGDALDLTDATINFLSTLNGLGKNWKKYILELQDYKPMSVRDNDDEGTQQTQQSVPGPGDDLPSQPTGTRPGDDLA